MRNNHQSELEVLRTAKWSKFLRRVRVFRFVPFVRFVLAAGSLATGELHPQSDFDVIVGVKEKRIFTVRFFSILIFEIFGWRRRSGDLKAAASDKICLNHFVAPRRYRLSEPHNAYWHWLYQHLVPVMGDETAIAAFFRANDWLRPSRIYRRDKRYLGPGSSWLKTLGEKALAGKLGDCLERILKKGQIRRIERGLTEKLGYQPRLVYNDDELEFHPDTRRIEEKLAQYQPPPLDYR